MEIILTSATSILLLYILLLRVKEKKTTVAKQLSDTIDQAKQPIRDYTNTVPLCIIVGMIMGGIIAFVAQTPKLFFNPIIIINLITLGLCAFFVIYPLVNNKRKIKKRIAENSIRKYNAILVEYKYHRVANKHYTFYPVYSFNYNEETKYILGDKPDRKNRLSKTVNVYIDEKENILFLMEH